jgi:hypothetical protein
VILLVPKKEEKVCFLFYFLEKEKVLFQRKEKKRKEKKTKEKKRKEKKKREEKNKVLFRTREFIKHQGLLLTRTKR